MYEAIVLSIVFLALTWVVFVCVVGTALPLLLNRSNVEDLMPLATKVVKVSIILAAISAVLELASPNTVVRESSFVIVTGVTFVWSWVILYVLKYRERQLLS